MKIITGNSNPELAEKIAKHCFATLVPANVSAFADGETSVEFLENIRGEDVFIVNSTSTPVNDSLMILLDVVQQKGLPQLFLTSVMLDKIEKVQVVHLSLLN
jgi:ribose-phosphate pyrophosphokinase